MVTVPVSNYVPKIEVSAESFEDLLPRLADIRAALDKGHLRAARIEWCPGDATVYRLVILPWEIHSAGREYLVSLLGPGRGCYPFSTPPHPDYLTGKLDVTPYTAVKLATFLAAWFGEPWT